MDGRKYDHTLAGMVRWLHDGGRWKEKVHTDALVTVIVEAIAELREREVSGPESS